MAELPYFLDSRIQSILDELELVAARPKLSARRKPRKWKPFVHEMRRRQRPL